MVKKYGKILILVMFVLSIIVAGCSSAKTPAPAAPEAAKPEVIELKWAQQMPVGHPWTDIGQKICDEVEKESNGRIKITNFPAGSLGKESETVTMMRSGSLAFSTSGPTILNSFYEPCQVFSFPYLFETKEKAYEVFEGPIGQKVFIDNILKNSGVRAIDFWYYGTRQLTTKGVAATKPQDLKGVKVRCMDNPVAKNVIAALGATPVPVSLAELYLSLQTGVVKGQENPLPTVYAQKFHEVQDYIINTNHSVHTGVVYVSEQIWQKLTEADRKLIMDVFKRNKPLIDKGIEAEAAKALEAMKAKGIKVIDPDIKAFQDYSKEFILNAYKDKADWMELYNQIIATR